ncbi:MAG TPA: hypothetical protein VMT16_05845 [Thermoanaerobaculia bacterium]|nr:hypothetical protein [Thermoanaerobaculia bacterium]
MRARCLLLVLLLGTVAAAAHAAGQRAVLGSDGEVYVVQSGELGQLFTDVPEEMVGNVALVLDVRRPGVPLQRLLVPGTENAASEESPALALNKRANTVYLVWAARQGIHSMLHLASWGPEGWSETLELSGDPFSQKSHPQLEVTIDDHAVAGAEGQAELQERTILHLLWWDEGVAGERALYTPLVADQGRPVASNPVFELAALLPEASEPPLRLPAPGLYRVPALRPGGDGRSLAMAFSDVVDGRLAGLEVQVLPADVMEIAERARPTIIEIGLRTGTWDLASLATEVRAEVSADGARRLQRPIAEFLGGEAAAVILAAAPGTDPAELADEARQRIIERGFSLGSPLDLGERARPTIIEIGLRSADGAELPQALMFRVASLRPTPFHPTQRPLQVFVSPSGEDVIVAWSAFEAVRYVESLGDGWSEMRTVETHETFTHGDAFAVLARRVGGR